MDPRTHPLVAGFDRAAASYDRSRPEYPPAALDLLDAELGLGPGRDVVDLAAGTGKLTRAIVARGARVVAVEPTPGMRAALARNVPDAQILDGTAEAIPLPTSSVDAVVVGQAFHWFDVPRAASEIARVLGPRGGLGIVFNERDERVPWVAELTRLLDAHDPGVPRVRRADWRAPLEATGRFDPLAVREFPHAQVGDVATLVERALSVSFIAVLPADAQRTVAESVRTLLTTDPATRGRDRIELPYRTRVYWTHRRA